MNIILYLLTGDRSLAEMLNIKTVYVSFVTELELLRFSKLTAKERKKVLLFLEKSVVIDINQEIKNGVVALSKKYKIKLPDSIILATASYLNIPLVTADKNLNRSEEANIILYER